jgi:hypothetical protein
MWNSVLNGSAKNLHRDFVSNHFKTKSNRNSVSTLRWTGEILFLWGKDRHFLLQSILKRNVNEIMYWRKKTSEIPSRISCEYRIHTAQCTVKKKFVKFLNLFLQTKITFHTSY